MKKPIGYQKGVNLGGWLSQGSLEKEHLDTFITENDIKIIASWGCDHVRLPVDFENIENDDGSVKESGYAYIDRCAEWCAENNLNMIIDLHKTYGYVFDDQEASKNFFDDTAAQDRFIALWENIIKRYADRSDRIMFEPLNEVVCENISDKWNALVSRCIDKIRSYAPNAKILVGEIGYNAPNAIELLPDFGDPNIVYNFHCYEPHIFTHQSASWVGYMPEDFRIRYPLPYDEYTRRTKEMRGQESDLCCNDKSVDTFGADYFKGVFSKAAEKAERCGAALYCGEYGVFNAAEPEDTLKWFSDIHIAFEEMGIGRAVWNYKGMGFGIVDSHLDEVRDNIIAML